MDSRKNSELYEFSKQIMNEYRKLDSDGEMYIQVGNKRNIIRSISNTSLIVTVLDDEELEIIKKMYHVEKSLQRERKNSNKIETLVGDLNKSNVTTKEGIEKVKRNSTNNPKESVKKSPSKKKAKRFKMSMKTKEKAKELLKKTGIKVSIGITSLALAITFAVNSAIEMKENVDRYDKEFNSMGEVEDKIKGIMLEELRKALNNENIEINISRVQPYKEELKGVEITLTEPGNYTLRKTFRRREGIVPNGNIRSKLLYAMADNYLAVPSRGNGDISNKDKNKAIKLLEQVEKLASKKDLKIKEIFGREYVKDVPESKAGDER